MWKGDENLWEVEGGLEGGVCRGTLAKIKQGVHVLGCVQWDPDSKLIMEQKD